MTKKVSIVRRESDHLVSVMMLDHTSIRYSSPLDNVIRLDELIVVFFTMLMASCCLDVVCSCGALDENKHSQR